MTAAIPTWIPCIDGAVPTISYHDDGTTVSSAVYSNSEANVVAVLQWYPNGILRSEGRMGPTEGPAYKEWSDRGFLSRETWTKNNKRHRDDGPAETAYYANGHVACEKWFKEGQQHRLDGPAIIWYDSDGNVLSEEYHRDNKAGL